MPATLVCNIAGYYPLDMTVKWTREELGGAPVPVSGASFSGLRQSSDGTYSISSFLTAEPGPEGTTYTCQITHISLEQPLSVSTWIAPPGTRSAVLSQLLYLGLLALLPPARLWPCSASHSTLFRFYFLFPEMTVPIAATTS